MRSIPRLSYIECLQRGTCPRCVIGNLGLHLWHTSAVSNCPANHYRKNNRWWEVSLGFLREQHAWWVACLYPCWVRCKLAEVHYCGVKGPIAIDTVQIRYKAPAIGSILAVKVPRSVLSALILRTDIAGRPYHANLTYASTWILKYQFHRACLMACWFPGRNICSKTLAVRSSSPGKRIFHTSSRVMTQRWSWRDRHYLGTAQRTSYLLVRSEVTSSITAFTIL